MLKTKPPKEKAERKKNTVVKAKKTVRKAIKTKPVRKRPSVGVSKGRVEDSLRTAPAVEVAAKAQKLIRPKRKISVKEEVPSSMPVKEEAIRASFAPVIEEVPPAPKVIPEEKTEKIEIKAAAPKVKEEVAGVTEVSVKVAVGPPQRELEIKLPVSVKDLSVKLQEKPSILIKTLMDLGIMAGINQILEDEVAKKLCDKFGCMIRKAPDEEELALRVHQAQDKPELLRPRPPIVTFMGHVDHGKTSLLDAIRKTKVVESEHGGITQHIGAYRVVLPVGEITFLDTPGHEAFTAMRARGASITDIVVLVVAADDGIMPQTQEAIDHARAAGVSIVVAINKIDKSQANIERVKKQLNELNLASEDRGGKTITVPVSAKTGKGIDELLEMILLEAQMLELKANPSRLASGVVLEAKITQGRGTVATLLVQGGTLHLNENIIVGKYYGKVRAMFNDRRHSVTEAFPSFPVEVLGISGTPPAGERFFVIEDEKTAKDLALRRQDKERQEKNKPVKRISLEDLYSQIKEGKLKELKLIIKADVHGSLGAIKDTLNKLNVSEIKMDFIHEGTGNINASDVILAAASNALILGFNVAADENAKELISKEGVDVRTYNIIYELANDIKAALEGMLEPELKKIFLGRVEVRKVFNLSTHGIVAGCFVLKGKITRNCQISLLRNSQAVYEGKISSLKRFKDDVKEVLEGFECGIVLSGFQDLKEGDIIEAYDIEKIARKL